jgi:hypothetical protein
MPSPNAHSQSSMTPAKIAQFQAALLDILDSQSDATAICASLSSLKLEAELVAYIDTFNPEMLEIAANLVKKWGQIQKE